MELNEKSWYAWLYKNTYDVEVLPENGCEFFWDMLFAFLVAIPAWPSYVLSIMAPKNIGGHFAIGLVINVVFCVGGMAVYPVLDNYSPLLSYLVGVVFTSLIVLLAVGIVYLVFKISKILPNRPKKNKPARQNVLKEYYMAFKDKHCPRIQWK